MYLKLAGKRNLIKGRGPATKLTQLSLGQKLEIGELSTHRKPAGIVLTSKVGKALATPNLSVGRKNENKEMGPEPEIILDPGSSESTANLTKRVKTNSN